DVSVLRVSLKPPILFGGSIPSFDNGNPNSASSSDTKLRIPLSKVGFPIRKSADQSFFAAPRGLSQRSTSFIASQRQGIHQMPLGHLIALIINTHPSRRWSVRQSAANLRSRRRSARPGTD